MEECGKCRPYCDGSALLWKQVIACSAMTCCCVSCRKESFRSFLGVAAKTCTLRLNVPDLPSLVAVCAGAKNIRVRCLAEERHSGCTVAGWKVGLTCRYTSMRRATGLVYAVG